jgi:hypothetical protein
MFVRRANTFERGAGNAAIEGEGAGDALGVVRQAVIRRQEGAAGGGLGICSLGLFEAGDTVIAHSGEQYQWTMVRARDVEGPGYMDGEGRRRGCRVRINQFGQLPIIASPVASHARHGCVMITCAILKYEQLWEMRRCSTTPGRYPRPLALRKMADVAL